MKKRGIKKRISYITALAMLITVLNIPFLGYADEEAGPASQNGFCVAIGDHIEGEYTPVTTDGIVVDDLLDPDIDYGDGPYHPFEISYGAEDAVPEGLITITSSDIDVVYPVLTKRVYNEATDEYDYIPQNDFVATSKLEVDDEGFTTQYFDLYYTGLGQANIKMTFTYPDGETVTMAEFPVTVKGVMVYLDKEQYIYDGKVKKPVVTVKDWEGNPVSADNYTVEYSEGSKVPGVYFAMVTFSDDYTAYQGTLYAYYVITPKGPSSVTTTLSGYDDIKVSWKASTGADGYYVYYKKGSGSYTYLKRVTGTSTTAKDLADGAKYTFKVIPYVDVYGEKVKSDSYKTSSYIYTLKKVSTPKVSKSSGSKVKVSWTNISGESGYQISKSTSKTKIKIVGTYKGTSLKSKTINATKGKKYYYKVRAFKYVKKDGKTVRVYGPWSSPKYFKR